jgi:hypothetical protein
MPKTSSIMQQPLVELQTISNISENVPLNVPLNVSENIPLNVPDTIQNPITSKMVLLSVIIILYISILQMQFYYNPIDKCSINSKKEKLRLFANVIIILMTIVRLNDLLNIRSQLKKDYENEFLFKSMLLVIIILLFTLFGTILGDIFYNNYEKVKVVEIILLTCSIINFILGMILIGFKVHFSKSQDDKYILYMRGTALAIIVFTGIFIYFTYPKAKKISEINSANAQTPPPNSLAISEASDAFDFGNISTIIIDTISSLL